MMGTGVIQGSRVILCDLFINTFKSIVHCEAAHWIQVSAA